MRHGIASSTGRPLAMLSFGANHYFTGMDPWPMKLTGVCWHLGNAILVFLLVRALLSTAAPRSAPSSVPNPGATAFFLALAWAVHPLQVSGVLYIVQRMEVGAYTFVILALLAYLKARCAQQEDRVAWPWFLASIASTVLGLGFKESALLAPAYAFVIEACLFRFRTGRQRPSKPLAALWAVLATGAIVVFLAYVLPPLLAPGAYSGRHFSLGERLLSQFPILCHYLGQIVLPLPQHLVFYYDQWPVSTGLLSPISTLWSLLLLLGLVVAAFASRHRWPLTSLGIGWFFVGHALTSNVIPLELAFEHRNYFALLGALLAIVQPLYAMFRHVSPGTRGLLAGLVCATLAALCAMHAHTWGDPMRLALALGTRNPESPRAAYALGGQFYEQAAGDPRSPAWSFARAEYERAAGLPNSSPLAEQALIVMDGKAGRPIPAQRWDAFRAKLTAGKTAGPEEIQSLYGVVNCRLQGGCELEDPQLADTLVIALRANPHSAVLHTIYANFAWNAMHDPALAIRMAREALTLEPSNTVNYVNLSRFLLASNLHQNKGRRREGLALLAYVKQHNVDGQWDADVAELETLAARQQGKGPDRTTD
ncbi:hypothetical protein [Marilutibacter spongiae]|nr:hypothetical protein [Lysobacter spongiae]